MWDYQAAKRLLRGGAGINLANEGYAGPIDPSEAAVDSYPFSGWIVSGERWESFCQVKD